ncbi:cell division topological specificity factor MinE [Numidum massiliense]|uniref:cell division topological specificity factor MinE n=1 Tax=Numidum massiliense TaxID=1522315 RepID=UPI0006D586EE|nr:cell division topological specificity factor MinE [Numidum massiliense]
MNFIERILGQKSRSADTADDRLSLVLSYQRMQINEERLEAFEKELIALCERFGFDVVGQVEVRPQSTSRNTVLNANIPVKMRGRSDIEQEVRRARGL